MAVESACGCSHSIGRTAGVLLLTLGCLTFMAAFALLRGRPWAWWFAVALFSIDALGDLVSYVVTHDAFRTIAGFCLSLIFLCMLCRRGVRGYFQPTSVKNAGY